MKRNKDQVMEPNASLTDRKYSSEKPWSCKYCYWWKGKNRGCGLKQCHYLILEKQKKRESAVSNKCKDCPYGKPVPCIGYCIASLYSEVRAKKGSG